MAVPRPPKLTLLYRVYAGLAGLALPFAFRSQSRRLQEQGISATRARERLGHPTLPRPSGPLIWCHAASVGESVSLLALIDALLAADPMLHVLVTSGTAGSAQVLAGRLPDRAFHQFAPLDARLPLARFLAHWRPALAILVESELWPQMIVRTHAASIPLALLNARLSLKSLRNWQKAPRTARALLGRFALVRAQEPGAAQALRALGAPECAVMGNLKAAARPLPFDPAMLAETRQALHGRPVWAAVSTHPGEEELILWAHKSARATIPDLMLILVPRHAVRGDDVAQLCRSAGLAFGQRSGGQAMDARTAVYLADTMGETGLWFALAPVVFLGGSLVPVGGHNPYEPALAGAAILHGPHVISAAPAYAGFDAAGGALQVADAATLARVLADLLSSPARLRAMQAAAAAHAGAQSADLSRLVADLCQLIADGPA